MMQSMALDDRRRELTIAAPIHQDAYSALLKDGYDAQMPDTVAGVDMIEQMRMWWKLWIEKIEQPIFPINWYVVSWPERGESWLELKPHEKRVDEPARAAYSHSASVGNLKCLPVFCESHFA